MYVYHIYMIAVGGELSRTVTMASEPVNSQLRSREIWRLEQAEIAWICNDLFVEWNQGSSESKVGGSRERG